MKRRKRETEEFDVSEFLRESDSDLRSALATMLQTPAVAAEPQPKADPNLIPGTELDPPTITGSGSELRSPSDMGAGPILSPGPSLAAAPALEPLPVFGRFPSPPPAPSIDLRPPPVTRIRIHQATSLHDGHTRAERHLYEILWRMAEPHDEHSRLITVGFATLGRFADLSESNARINLRSLIRKRAVEEYHSYDCAQSRGRTYRVFDEAAVMERRREAGLQWYRKRTMGVVFVDPKSGEPV